MGKNLIINNMALLQNYEGVKIESHKCFNMTHGQHLRANTLGTPYTILSTMTDLLKKAKPYCMSFFFFFFLVGCVDDVQRACTGW